MTRLDEIRERQNPVGQSARLGAIAHAAEDISYLLTEIDRLQALLAMHESKDGGDGG